MSALRGKLLPYRSVWGGCLARYLLYSASCVSQTPRTLLAVATEVVVVIIIIIIIIIFVYCNLVVSRWQWLFYM